MKKLILLIIFLAGCAAAPDKELIVLQVDMELLKKQIDTLQTDLRIEQEKLVILSCESKFRHDGIWGDNGRSYGIAQFQKPTFDELKTRAGKTTLQWTKQEDQL